MVAKKKKKKKEEFDASLMGGYLPGARAPVASTAPIKILRAPKVWNLPQTPILIFNPHVHEYGVEHEHWEDGLLSDADEFMSAWAYYGLAGVADPGNFIEAFAWRRAFGVPLVAGYALAGIRGFVLTGVLLTIIDPMHKREGKGLDEKGWYKKRITYAARKPAWGTDQGGKKDKREYRWGTSV